MKGVGNLLHLDCRTEKSNRGLCGHGDPTITEGAPSLPWARWTEGGSRGSRAQGQWRPGGSENQVSLPGQIWARKCSWGKTEKEKYLGFSLLPFSNRLPEPQTQPESLNIQPKGLTSVILRFNQEQLKCQIWRLWGQIGYGVTFFFFNAYLSYVCVCGGAGGTSV